MSSDEEIDCHTSKEQGAVECILKNGEKSARVVAQRNQDGKPVIIEAKGDPDSVQRVRKRMNQLGISI